MKTGGPRVAWVDAARGLCLLLVVLGHGLLGLLNGHLIDLTPGVEWSLLLLYSFHMPVFFWLSGLVARDPARGWALYLVWPYILWTELLLLMQMALPGASHAVAEWGSMLRIGWEPVTMFWFLQALIVIKAVDYGASRLLGPERAAQVLLAACGGTAMVLDVLDADVWPVFRILVGATFYMLGRVVTLPGAVRVLDRSRGVLLPVAAGAFAVLAVWAAVSAGEGVHGWRFVWRFQQGIIVTGLLGIAGVTALAGMAVRLESLRRGLVLLGVCAMTVYVQHVFWAAGVRFVLKAQVGDMGLLLGVMVLAGLVMPVAWQRVADRLGVTPWFGIRKVW